MSTKLSRREFNAALSGLVIAFSMTPQLTRAQGMVPAMLRNNRRLDSWLRIGADGTVTVSSGRVELGQGNLTALAQIAADELDVAFSRVRMVAVDTTRSPNEGGTVGSNSMEAGGAALRQAAAEARAILLEKAAERLAVPANSFSVEDGTVRSGDKTITYWAIAADISLRRESTGAARPKAPAAHKIVGRSAQRIDIPDKVMGRAAYVHDMRLPGMLFGRVVRPPNYRSELTAFDDAAVKQMPGVMAVVRDGRFIGVVAAREEQAIDARARAQEAAKWRVPADMPTPATAYDYLKSRALPGDVVHTVAGPEITPAKTVSATYRKPYLAHASIGTSAAVAHFTDGALTVWSHTQGPYPLRGDIAKALGMEPGKVRVIHVQGSGCYGHNGADDVALDAALLARAVPGRPVKVQWMRNDEFGWEPFGSAMEMTGQAGLDADGNIVNWQYDVWTCSHNMRPGNPRGLNLLAAQHLEKPFAAAIPVEAALPAGGGDRNAVPTYAVGKMTIVDHFVQEMPLRVSALRTLGGFGNVFAVESFMDELAEAAGADPVAFRLKHLPDARARAVVQAAADKAAWNPGAKGDGTRGRGVAFSRYETIKAYVAVFADVAVDADGRVRVERVAAATDAGMIVNPDGLINQIEGGIIQGTSWTLKEQVGFDKERILTRDWNAYPILTFAEVPAVDVVLIDHPEQPSLGAGEASQGPIAAAIANAIHHATGKRLRELPFTPERVRAARTT